MRLAIGTRVGPYEILSAIGQGGMGEVYRARDTQLKRDVAIKVLPDAVAHDRERVSRFHREAELLAAINHPNIAAVYGLEHAEGLSAIVLELVEGETLDQRIRRGPVAPADALPIARHIAAALEAAHEKGVIHRDLKPANIVLAHDGSTKVLDFGIAKALGATPADGGASADAAVTNTAVTALGIVMGTVGYLSPEQAKGRPADKRSDIWAFGCVLFEMLAGRPAFHGEGPSDTLAAILMKDPDWALIPSTTPPAARAVLRSCLQKDRQQRVRDIGDVGLALQGAFETGAAAPPERTAKARPTTLRRAILLGATLIAATIAGGATVWLATRSVPPRTIRTEITTSGATALLVNGFNRDLAITPDGSRIVYRGQAQLLVRALDRLEPTVLSGLGSPRGVFVSPDGQWVGFFDGNTLLKKVAISGGPPLTVCSVDGNGTRGAAWGPDGTIIFATNGAGKGLQRVSAAGGNPTVLTKPDVARGERDHFWPEFLPDGKAVLFTIRPASGAREDAQLAVLDLQSGTHKVLLRGGSHAHYVPTGHLVYGAAGTVRAVPFDVARREVTGPPISVLEQVVTTPAGVVDMVVAANGTMVYVPGGVAGAAGSLIWVDRAGREEPLPAPARTYTYPRLSPDGTRIAVNIRDERGIWTWDIARRTLTRLTLDSDTTLYSTWSPDSRRVLFASTRAGGQNLFSQSADGKGTAERLTDGPHAQGSSAITPDGTRIAFGEVRPSTGEDIMIAPLHPPRGTQPLIQTKFNERNPEVSPDGRWLAYESNESGREEIYVRPFPDVGGGRWQVSAAGGRMPLWSRNGTELFYMSLDNSMMGVQVEPGDTWRSSTPARILQRQYFESGIGSPRTFDVAQDGRFLMIKQGGEHAPETLVVVQNWFEELKRRVPPNR